MSRSPEDVIIRAGTIELTASLGVPPSPIGLVLLAHASGSARHSPRNQRVAHALRARGLGALLLDLLTPDEEHVDAIDRSRRDEVGRLTERLIAATAWARRQPDLGALPIGYFAASTGAAAALRAAARRPDLVRAVVSAGGRPDLAHDVLADVRAPTLLIVGSDDPDLLALNRSAARRLGGTSRIAIVLGATHLFEEPGALDQVARLAVDWLVDHLGARAGEIAGAAADPPPRAGRTILPFKDRRSAGRLLAPHLARYRDDHVLVIGIPRGGVPVADEVARALRTPLDVWICRKLGAPPEPELGLGAVAEGGALVVDRDLADRVGVSPRELRAIVRREVDEVRARQRRLRSGAPPPDVRGRTVVIVDDGIATGGTIRAAIRAIHRCGAGRIVVAVPVAAPETLADLREEVDELVCLTAPEQLLAIGVWYDDFHQIPDDEVVRILGDARAREATGGGALGGAMAVSPPA